MEEKSLAKNLAGTVKSVLGSCLSVGCTVDKLNPKQVIAKINNGEIKVWLFKTTSKFCIHVINNANNFEYLNFLQ